MTDLLSWARSFAASAAERAADGEAARRVPDDLVAHLRDAGVFRSCVPASLGGLELAPHALVDVLEAISAGDGSTGWVAMICATSGLTAAYMEDAADVFSGPDVIVGGVFAPMGSAEAGEGGWTVNGRWRFASGCEHCDWLLGGTVIGDAAPMLVFASDDIEIHDTWDTGGLCATGSHDYSVSDVFVPSGRSVDLSGPPRSDGALYRFPGFGLLALGIAAVCLGVGRGAIDEFLRLATVKSPSFSRRRLAERSSVQSTVARAEAKVRSARAFVDDAVGRCWDEANGAGRISIEGRVLLRLAATNATAMSASAVSDVYELAGGTSVYRSSRLSRDFRDIHTATQHMMVAAPTLEVAGRVLLGVETDTAML